MARTMFGCSSWVAARNSWASRWCIIGFSDSVALSTLMATAIPVLRSRARKTVPIPPLPIGSPNVYRLETGGLRSWVTDVLRPPPGRGGRVDSCSARITRAAVGRGEFDHRVWVNYWARFPNVNQTTTGIRPVVANSGDVGSVSLRTRFARGLARGNLRGPRAP